jgi:DNA-directed RNA polymerase alpha subunit
MKLTSRTERALTYAGIYTSEDLECLTENMLLRIPNFGRKSLSELKDACEEFGVELLNEKYKNLLKLLDRYAEVQNNNMSVICGTTKNGLMKFEDV